MRNLARTAVALAAGLSLSACASLAPTLPAGSIAVPASLAAAAAPAAEARAGDWSALGDPVLTGLIGRALEANTDLRIAEARMDAARARYGAARSNALPSGGFVAEQQETRRGPAVAAEPRIEDASARFLMSWEVDLFGRLASLRQAAGSRLAASEADLEAARLSIAAEVARTYFLHRGASESAAIRERFRDAQAQVVELTATLAAEGRLAPGEVARARAELASDEADALLARDRVARLEAALAVLLAEVPGRWTVPEAPALGSLALVPIALPEPAALIVARPDVRAAAHALEAENAEIGAALAARLPRLSVFGVFGFWSGGLGDLGSSGRSGTVHGGSLQWNVLDLPRLEAEADLARAETAEALAAYDRAVLRALEDAGNAVREHGSAQQRAEARLRQSAEARLAADAAYARFEEGASAYLDALAARRDAQRADLAATDALVDQRLAVIDLLRALATPPRPAPAPPPGQGA
jgi:multidrug efflux system outer membrane protein